MYRFILILFLLVMIGKASAQPSWSQVSSLPPSGYMHCMQFANNSTGFIGTDTCMYKTTNGGINWLRTIDHHLLSIQFVNSRIGFALFDANSAYENNFLKTTDSGQNWFSTIPNSLTNTFMIDSLNGYTRFYSNFVLGRTTNGAVSWMNSNYNFNYENRLFFMDNITGLMNYNYYIKPTGYFSILRTNNGGSSYSTVYSSQATRVNSNYFKVLTNAGYAIYAGSSTGYILKSNDTGLTWQILSTGFNQNSYSSIYFTNENTGYASGGYQTNGYIIKTTNAGQSWFNSFNFTGGLMSYVSFTDSLTGYLLSSNGKIYKTNNGGVTGIGQSFNEMPSDFKLFQNYPNPFNPTTNINYELPNSNFVSLKVYDVLGNEVETLVNENQNAGNYAITFDASSKPSGIYFYTLSAGTFKETRKMLLIK